MAVADLHLIQSISISELLYSTQTKHGPPVPVGLWDSEEGEDWGGKWQ